MPNWDKDIKTVVLGMLEDKGEKIDSSTLVNLEKAYNGSIDEVLRDIVTDFDGAAPTVDEINNIKKAYLKKKDTTIPTASSEELGIGSEVPSSTPPTGEPSKASSSPSDTGVGLESESVNAPAKSIPEKIASWWGYEKGFWDEKRKANTPYIPETDEEKIALLQKLSKQYGAETASSITEYNSLLSDKKKIDSLGGGTFEEMSSKIQGVGGEMQSKIAPNLGENLAASKANIDNRLKELEVQAFESDGMKGVRRLTGEETPLEERFSKSDLRQMQFLEATAKSSLIGRYAALVDPSGTTNSKAILKNYSPGELEQTASAVLGLFIDLPVFRGIGTGTSAIAKPVGDKIVYSTVKTLFKDLVKGGVQTDLAKAVAWKSAYSTFKGFAAKTAQGVIGGGLTLGTYDALSDAADQNMEAMLDGKELEYDFKRTMGRFAHGSAMGGTLGVMSAGFGQASGYLDRIVSNNFLSGVTKATMKAGEIATEASIFEQASAWSEGRDFSARGLFTNGALVLGLKLTSMPGQYFDKKSTRPTRRDYAEDVDYSPREMEHLKLEGTAKDISKEINKRGDKWLQETMADEKIPLYTKYKIAFNELGLVPESGTLPDAVKVDIVEKDGEYIVKKYAQNGNIKEGEKKYLLLTEDVTMDKKEAELLKINENKNIYDNYMMDFVGKMDAVGKGKLEEKLGKLSEESKKTFSKAILKPATARTTDETLVMQQFYKMVGEAAGNPFIGEGALESPIMQDALKGKADKKLAPAVEIVEGEKPIYELEIGGKTEKYPNKEKLMDAVNQFDPTEVKVRVSNEKDKAAIEGLIEGKIKAIDKGTEKSNAIVLEAEKMAETAQKAPVIESEVSQEKPIDATTKVEVEQELPTKPADLVADTPSQEVNQKGKLNLYHGTPFKFDKFDLKKIGTGEGAQAFGHGLYFTDLKDIAQWYADKLSSEKISISPLDKVMVDKFYDNGKAENLIDAMLEDFSSSWLRNEAQLYGEMMAVLEGTPSKELSEVVKNTIKANESKIREISNKYLYKVSVGNGKELNFVEWDKPVTEEQKNKILENLPINPAKKNKVENLKVLLNKNINGQTLYESLSDIFNSNDIASEYLKKAGVDGIKYPAESKGENARGSNYVIFDPKIITIEEINGIKQQLDKDIRDGLTTTEQIDNIANADANIISEFEVAIESLETKAKNATTNKQRKVIIDEIDAELSKIVADTPSGTVETKTAEVIPEEVQKKRTQAAEASEEVVMSFDVPNIKAEQLKEAKVKLSEFIKEHWQTLGLTKAQERDLIARSVNVKTKAQAQKIIDKAMSVSTERKAAQEVRDAARKSFIEEFESQGDKADVKASMNKWLIKNKKSLVNIPPKAIKLVMDKINKLRKHNYDESIKFIEKVIGDAEYANKVNRIQEKLDKIKKKTLGDGDVLVDLAGRGTVVVQGKNRINKQYVQTLLNKLDITNEVFREDLLIKLEKAIDDLSQPTPKFDSVSEFVDKYEQVINEAIESKLAKKPVSEKDVKKLEEKIVSVHTKVAELEKQMISGTPDIKEINSVNNSVYRLTSSIKDLIDRGELQLTPTELKALNSQLEPLNNWFEQGMNKLTEQARNTYHEAMERYKVDKLNETPDIRSKELQESRPALFNDLNDFYKVVDNLKKDIDGRKRMNPKFLQLMNDTLLEYEKTAILGNKFGEAYVEYKTASIQGAAEKIQQRLVAVQEKIGGTTIRDRIKRLANSQQAWHTMYTDLTDDLLLIKTAYDSPYFQAVANDQNKAIGAAEQDTQKAMEGINAAVNKVLRRTKGKTLARAAFSTNLTKEDNILLRQVSTLKMSAREYANASFSPGMLTVVEKGMKIDNSKLKEKIGGIANEEVRYMKKLNGDIEVFKTSKEAEAYFNQNKELFIDGLDYMGRMLSEGKQKSARLSESNVEDKFKKDADVQAYERLLKANGGKPLIIKSDADIKRLLSKEQYNLHKALDGVFNDNYEKMVMTSHITGQKVYAQEVAYFPALSVSMFGNAGKFNEKMDKMLNSGEDYNPIKLPRQNLFKLDRTENYINLNPLDVVQDYLHETNMAYHVLPVYKAQSLALARLAQEYQYKSQTGHPSSEHYSDMAMFYSNMRQDLRLRYENQFKVEHWFSKKGFVAFGQYRDIEKSIKNVKAIASSFALVRWLRPVKDVTPQLFRQGTEMAGAALVGEKMNSLQYKRSRQVLDIADMLPKGSLMNNINFEITARFDTKQLNQTDLVKLKDRFLALADNRSKPMAWIGAFDYVYKGLTGEKVNFDKLKTDEAYQAKILNSDEFNQAVAMADKDAARLHFAANEAASKQAIDLFGVYTFKKGDIGFSFANQLTSYVQHAAQGLGAAAQNSWYKTGEGRTKETAKALGVINNNIAYAVLALTERAMRKYIDALMAGRDDEAEKAKEEFKKIGTTEGAVKIVTSSAIAAILGGWGTPGINLMNLSIDAMEGMLKGLQGDDKLAAQKVSEDMQLFRASTSLYKGSDWYESELELKSLASYTIGATGTFIWDYFASMGGAAKQIVAPSKAVYTWQDTPERWDAVDLVLATWGLLTKGTLLPGDADASINAGRRFAETAPYSREIKEAKDIAYVVGKIKESRKAIEGKPSQSTDAMGNLLYDIPTNRGGEEMDKLSNELYKKDYFYLSREEQMDVMLKAEKKEIDFVETVAADARGLELMQKNVKLPGYEGTRTYRELSNGFERFEHEYSFILDLYTKIQNSRKYPVKTKQYEQKAKDVGVPQYFDEAPYPDAPTTRMNAEYTKFDLYRILDKPMKDVKAAIWGEEKDGKVDHYMYEKAYSNMADAYQLLGKIMGISLEDEIKRAIAKSQAEIIDKSRND